MIALQSDSFNGVHTPFESHEQGHIFNPCYFRPFRYGFGFTHYLYTVIAGCISGLLFGAGPYAVCWGVVVIAVLSFKGTPFWSFPHIGYEVFKNHPSITDSNTLTTIDNPINIGGVSASPYHGFPCIIEGVSFYKSTSTFSLANSTDECVSSVLSQGSRLWSEFMTIIAFVTILPTHKNILTQNVRSAK